MFTHILRVMAKAIFWISIGFLAVVVIANAYTYEGELDPGVLDTWKIIEGSPKLVDPNILTLIVENPDKTSSIKRVWVFIDRRNELISYDYFKNGEVFDYRYDLEKDKYVRHLYTDEELRGCMECHKNIALHCS